MNRRPVDYLNALIVAAFLLLFVGAFIGTELGLLPVSRACAMGNAIAFGFMFIGVLGLVGAWRRQFRIGEIERKGRLAVVVGLLVTAGAWALWLWFMWALVAGGVCG